ncbi:MAG: hypothetical protein EPO26_04800 [Chloroflexota bacterium]|nr:MAG: hypothetical protein EPO26_04800 [Chloroflexota bacterium]
MRWAVGVAFLVLCVAVGGVAAGGAAFGRLYDNRVYPGVHIGGVDVGGLSRDSATRTLSAAYDRYLAAPLRIHHGGREWRVAPRDLGARADVGPSLDAAFSFGRGAPFLERMQRQIISLRAGVGVPEPVIAIDDARIQRWLRAAAPLVESAATRAELALQPDVGVVILPSIPGRRLDVSRSAAAIAGAIREMSAETIELAIEEIPAALDERDLASIRDEARQAIGSSVAIEAPVGGTARRWEISPTELVDLVLLHSSGTNPPNYRVEIHEERLRARLEAIAREIDTEPREPRYRRDDTRLSIIDPGRDGARVDVAASMRRVRDAIRGDQRVAQLTIDSVTRAFGESRVSIATFPDLIEDVTTTIVESTPNRAFNVALAASRFDGIIVAPGDTFSFLRAVGDISERSGYRPVPGRRTEGDGNSAMPTDRAGISQVATTLFQAIFWSGFAIAERSPHAYWISRYGTKPRGLKGLDAAVDQVYDREGRQIGAVDFAWRNTSAEPVLISVVADDTRVRVRLWGHRPDWQVRVTEPRIERVIRTGTETRFHDDTTIPRGATFWVERAEDGFDVALTRTLLRGGRVIAETRFTSTYAPSRNVVARGSDQSTATDEGMTDDRPARIAARGTADAQSLLTPIPTLVATPKPPPRTVTATRVSSPFPRSSTTPRPPATRTATARPAVARP